MLLNGEPVEEFSETVVEERAYEKASYLTSRLKELIPRQQYEVKIQGKYKGKIIASVEDVDSADARAILKGHTCVLMRGPFSLRIASPDEIVEYYKELFDKYGKGGGVMFNIRLPEKGSLEDIQKMVAKIRDYCRY